MSEDRRAHQCHRDGCDTQAAWQLWLQFECTGIVAGEVGRLKLQSESTLKVCNRRSHQNDAIRFLLSPSNKAAIAAGLKANGLPPPDFASACPILVPLSAAAIVAAEPGDLRALGAAEPQHG